MIAAEIIVAESDHPGSWTVAPGNSAPNSAIFMSQSVKAIFAELNTSTYFATFQVASGDRMELQMPGQEYGLIIEGDFGDLTFQGTRFLSFSRKVKAYEEV